MITILVGWCIGVFLLVTIGTCHYRNTDAISKTMQIFSNDKLQANPFWTTQRYIRIDRLNVLKANKEWDSPTLFRTSQVIYGVICCLHESQTTLYVIQHNLRWQKRMQCSWFVVLHRPVAFSNIVFGCLHCVHLHVILEV